MPQPPSATTRGTVRITRIIHGALIVSIFLYGLMLRIIAVPPNPQPLDKTLLAMLGALALGVIALFFVLRSKWITTAYVTLRAKPDDALSLAPRRKGAVVLDGAAIYFIGGGAREGRGVFLVGGGGWMGGAGG